MNLSDIELFPVVNVPSPVYRTDAPIQHWTGASQLPPNAPIPPGVVFYPCIDDNPASPTAGQLIAKTIPAAQYYGPPNVPTGGQASIGQAPNTVNTPPVDMAKYNALAAEHEKIVATPWGILIEPTDPAPAAQAGGDSLLVQQIAADVAAIKAIIVTKFGG